MSAAKADGDLFDEVYDNRRTEHREIWRGGALRRFCQRTACGNSAAYFREVHAPWGHYPDLPSNASEATA